MNTLILSCNPANNELKPGQRQPLRSAALTAPVPLAKALCSLCRQSAWVGATASLLDLPRGVG